MKSIQLDLFTRYRFLSDLTLSLDESRLAYVESRTDLENNDYQQRMHVMDTKSRQEVFAGEWMKRCVIYPLDDDSLLMIRNDEKNPLIHTRFVRISLSDGKECDSFSLPCIVNKIEVFNEDYYLVNAVIQRSLPHYHHLSEEEQKQALENKKKDDDYIILDEYPFFFNGEGIINGNRSTLLLVNRKTHEIKDLVKETIDVESYDICGDELVYCGVDYTSFKGKWSHVWKMNVVSGDTSVLFDDVMQISRVFFQDQKVIVLGTFAKEYGAMEAAKFYELRDKTMYLVADNEYSMYNSVGSDCRFGRVKNFLKKNDQAYFITTDGSRSIVVRLTDHGLEKVVDFEGSCDDFVVKDDEIYLIAMKDQKLQEVYVQKDDKLEQLTCLNEEVLKDVYVAHPEKVILDKETPIVGWVLKPKDYDPHQSYPAIMDIHGGPKTAYGEVFYHEMQAWANLGYFVFFCNPRGSDGRGNAFADLRRNFGKIDYEDLMDFCDLVLKLYPAIDKERLGVTGGSYGGYMTNWIVGHTDRFKAAASQRSISNWISEVCASDYGIDFPIEQEFDDLYDCQQELWDMSPLKYVNHVKTPTLFIHSIEDYRCPVWEALQMYTALKCRKVETKLVAFKGENHELSRSGKPLHRLRRLNEITQWMEKYLK